MPLCVQQRNDDEAVVDRGGARTQQGDNIEQEDLEGTWMDSECILENKKLQGGERAAAAESAYSVLTAAAFLLTAFS